MGRREQQLAEVSLLSLCLIVAITDGAPSARQPTWPAVVPYNRSSNGCVRQETVQQLCQLCAHATKSHTVYPMCCDNLDEVRPWCQKYITFGIRLPSSASAFSWASDDA